MKKKNERVNKNEIKKKKVHYFLGKMKKKEK